MTNALVWVPQGGMLQISKTVLHAELPGARASEITYSIVKDQPRHGKSLWHFVLRNQLRSVAFHTPRCAHPYSRVFCPQHRA